ncbi:MAG: GNAT family N-acetyltransferase [Prochlorothrix sp.]
MPLSLHPYHPLDRPQLLPLMTHSIFRLGPCCYRPDQVAVWAQASAKHLRAEPDPLLQGQTWVATLQLDPDQFVHDPWDGDQAGFVNKPLNKVKILGFAQLQPIDRVSLLYVAADATRQGVGQALYGQLETIDRTQQVRHLRTEASHVARPFFVQQGFQVQGQEWVTLEGVAIDRWVMTKPLEPLVLRV